MSYRVQTIVRMLITTVFMVLISQTAVAQTMSGAVDFNQRFQVQSILKGTVVQVNASVGDKVAAGTIVIELDSARQQAKVLMAQNQVAKKTIEVEAIDAQFARDQELFDRGSLSILLYEESENALKLAELDLSSAQARLNAAMHKLSLTKLASPVDTIVIASNVYSGMQVHPYFTHAPLMTLASDGEYVIRLAVPTETRQKLVQGQTINIIVEGRSYTAQVVIPALDPLPLFQDEPEYPIHLRFTEKDRLILPGTLVSVIFE